MGIHPLHPQHNTSPLRITCPWCLTYSGKMSTFAVFRAARFAPRVARPMQRWSLQTTQKMGFSSTMRRRAGGEAGHHEETYEEFTQRYENEFNNVQDVFELQRNLNNAFAYDLVPSPSVIIAALKAARRERFPNCCANLRRHRDEGGEQGPVRRIPQGARAHTGGTRHQPQGDHVPRGHLVRPRLRLWRVPVSLNQAKDITL